MTTLKKCTLVAIAVCLVVFVCVQVLRAQSSDTNDWEKAAGGKMSFEVASVKQNKADVASSGERPNANIVLDDSDSYSPTGGLVSITNYPVPALIAFAYKVNLFEYQRLLAGLPNWARSDRFDVEARGPSNSTKDQMRLMMQSLLADRFKLAAHFETRNAPIYNLVLAKPAQMGPQLTPYSDAHPCVDPAHPTPAAPNSAPSSPCHTPMARNTPDGGIVMSESDVSIQKMADDLSIVPPANINRRVVDHTGLSGNYDFTINFPKGMSRAGVSVDDPEPSFGELLQEQLGLKLESATGPVRSLVIEHIEEPTPN